MLGKSASPSFCKTVAVLHKTMDGRFCETCNQAMPTGTFPSNGLFSGGQSAFCASIFRQSHFARNIENISLLRSNSVCAAWHFSIMPASANVFRAFISISGQAEVSLFTAIGPNSVPGYENKLFCNFMEKLPALPITRADVLRDQNRDFHFLLSLLNTYIWWFCGRRTFSNSSAVSFFFI